MIGIDYSLAGKMADYVHAISIIESQEKEMTVGDGGEAFGLDQQHPAFFVQNYGRMAKTYPQSVHHTWLEAFIVAAASFFAFNLEIMRYQLDDVVRAYNQGETMALRWRFIDPKSGIVYTDQKQAAENYLMRFDHALELIKKAKDPAQTT